MNRKRCSQCFFHKQTLVTDWRDSALTCLHPLSRNIVGRALSCHQARDASAFCGPDGFAFTPIDAAPNPAHAHWQ